MWPRYLSSSQVVFQFTEEIEWKLRWSHFWWARTTSGWWGEVPVKAEAVRGQREILINRCSEYFLVPPKTGDTCVNATKIKISDTQIYCYQDEGNWQHILQPSEAFRSSPDHLWILHSYPRTEEDILEMKGEEGVTPTYIYSAIVIWHNILLISVVLLSAFLSSYIYLHISNV